jgi:DNA mismatch endonuclease (patch repair protein)
MDIYPQAKRSEIMRKIRGKNTTPEMKVRSLLHSLGFRFRLQRKDLPGKPDLVLPKYKTAIFVHGCFWHGHSCGKGKHLPKTNSEFWVKKINDNICRDNRDLNLLVGLGWKVLVVWECETKDTGKLSQTLRENI